MSRLVHAARHPMTTAVNVGARSLPGPLFRRAGRAARRAGLEELLIVVSLDCDTERDIESAPAVHERLRSLGVQPIYAVAGELLELGADVWRALAADGSEFLNHGGRAHARWDAAAGVVESTFFYDRATPAEVESDVRAGHDAVARILGKAPTGFRTPHFGTFQGRTQLRSLHVLLRSLGYRYSTSTLPAWAYRRGPVFSDLGLPELPVTGFASRPLQPFDTWACFFAPDRVHTPDDYVREARRLAALVARGGAGLLNLYGDPLHVADDHRFDEGLRALLSVARPSSYAEVLARTT